MRGMWWVVVLGIVAVLAGCGKKPGPAGARHDLVADMVSFDRLLVPAVLRCAGGNDPAPALAALAARWAVLKPRYTAELTADPANRADFARLDAALSAAIGGPRAEAYAALDDVRSALRDIRQRRGITYYLDALTVYHQHLAKFSRLTAGKTDGTLTPDDRAALARALPVLASLWQDTFKVPCDAGLFGLTAQKVVTLRAAVGNETTALRNLKEALDTADTPKILRRMDAVTAAFTAAYGVFGE